MTTRPDLALVFPGQGSQAVGMLGALAAAHPVIRETFDEAASILGLDLWALCQSGPEDALAMTVNTQPALLASGVALWRAWTARGGPAPALVAGHSLGEYTALVCAGGLRFTDAVALVAERGRCMQEAVPPGSGAMAAILGLDDDAVVSACDASAGGEVVSAVNFNAPGQVVIAGNRGAVERAMQAAKDAGAKRCMLLPVSVPSHCALMQPAAERFRPGLEAAPLADVTVPVVQNYDAVPRTDAAGLRDALLRQLYSPVRWVDCVQTLRQQGVSHFLECGPGKVLCGLIKRIDAGAGLHAIGEPAAFNGALEGLA